jgi:transcriptional regulator with XRE-family HTH domain
MLRVHRAKTPFERCVYPVLKEALEKTDLSQIQLAKECGVAQSTIIRWTFGDCECTVKFLLKLEEITGKPFREAVPGTVWGMRGARWKGIAISQFRKKRQRNC